MAQWAIEGDASCLNDVARLLQRLLTAAEAGGRQGSVIEILIVQSLTRRAGGDIPDALTPLERALTLAEPEGYVRLFVNEGTAMASLLKAVAGRRAGWGYVRRLLAAFARDGAAAGRSPADPPTRRTQRLVDPLSERELEVLRLLATDLDGPAIARQLIVSVNTMRTRTKSIYAKLGVNSRRAALRRAEDLDLLSRSRGHRP